MRIYRHFILLLVIITAVITSCRRELSEKQKQEMQEAKKDQAITRMTDREIVQDGLEAGRAIRQAMENDRSADSLLAEYDARFTIFPGDKAMNDMELELWEAYQTGWESGNYADENIQRAYPEYLYYTYPLTENDSLAGMVSIRLSRKEIILHH